MRIPFGWLQNFVKLDISPQEACEQLIMLGFSDAEVIPNEWDCLDNFVVGRATKVESHPGDDHLKIVDVNLGYTTLKSVCGAPNVVTGGAYAVALPGAKLGSGQTVSRAEISGVVSECVLCSGWEAWLDDSRDSLLELDKDLVPGTRLIEALGLDEPVIEVEVTPNRGDCLGLVGIARELAAVFGKELIIPEPAPKYGSKRIEDLVDVEIHDEDACPRYGAMVLEKVSVRPSRATLRAQLRLAGLRAVNNVVDAANLVMFETGHPLHAFDLDKIEEAHVIVRRAAEGEKIVGIDGAQYSLGPEDLVIADPSKPIAIAGVIGGENSEVTSTTRRILIEGAFFKKSVIWRMSKRLAIDSEAAYRFARGVDIEAIPYVLAQAAELIQDETSCDVCRGRIDVYPGQRPPRYVTARPKRINRLLGTAIPDQEICDYLERLGFGVSPGRDLEVAVPTRRGDVESEVDIAEEVARLYGYDRIRAAEERACSAHGKVSSSLATQSRLRTLLAGMGLTEVVTDSMVSPEVLNLFGMLPSQAVDIRNPVGVGASVLRTGLVPGIVEVLVKNEHRGEESIAVFEIGKIYDRNNANFCEKYRVGLGLSGLNEPRIWCCNARQFDFFDLKGMVEALLRQFGLEAAFVPGGPEFLHLGRKALLRGIEGNELGFVGEILPDLCGRYGSRRRLYVAELEFEPFLESISVISKVSERPKYPGVKRDIAVIVSKTVLDSDVRRIILEEGGDLVESLETFDVYEGKPVPENHKSLAYAIVFRDRSRTLKEVEVDEIQKRIEKRINEELKGTLRKE